MTEQANHERKIWEAFKASRSWATSPGELAAIDNAFDRAEADEAERDALKAAWVYHSGHDPLTVTPEIIKRDLGDMEQEGRSARLQEQIEITKRLEAETERDDFHSELLATARILGCEGVEEGVQDLTLVSAIAEGIVDRLSDTLDKLEAAEKEIATLKAERRAVASSILTVQNFARRHGDESDRTTVLQDLVADAIGCLLMVDKPAALRIRDAALALGLPQ